jgi:hypothetical protein
VLTPESRQAGRHEMVNKTRVPGGGRAMYGTFDCLDG